MLRNSGKFTNTKGVIGTWRGFKTNTIIEKGIDQTAKDRRKRNNKNRNEETKMPEKKKFLYWYFSDISNWTIRNVSSEDTKFMECQ